MTEMNLKLIYHPKMLPHELPANRGFDLSKIKVLLEQVEQLGVSWEVIETSKTSEEELSSLYIEAISPAVHHKYPVRQIFGSKRNSGFMFGKGVPALVVYESSKDYPSDIYPHGAGDHVVTIKVFLEGLLKKLERASLRGESRRASRALVERMDRLRKEIGPIGVPVAELVREGRRR